MRGDSDARDVVEDLRSLISIGALSRDHVLFQLVANFTSQALGARSKFTPMSTDFPVLASYLDSVAHVGGAATVALLCGEGTSDISSPDPHPFCARFILIPSTDRSISRRVRPADPLGGPNLVDLLNFHRLSAAIANGRPGRERPIVRGPGFRATLVVHISDGTALQPEHVFDFAIGKSVGLVNTDLRAEDIVHLVANEAEARDHVKDARFVNQAEEHHVVRGDGSVQTAFGSSFIDGSGGAGSVLEL